MAKKSDNTLYEMLKPVYYGSRNEGGRWPRGHWTLEDADAAGMEWLSEHNEVLALVKEDVIRRTMRDIDRHEQANISDLSKMCLPGFEKELERLLEKPIATATGERVALGDCDPYEEWDNYWEKREDGFAAEDTKRARDRRIHAHVRRSRRREEHFQTIRDLLIVCPVPAEP